MADPGDGQAGFTLLQGAVAFGAFLGGALAAFLGAKAKGRRSSGDGVEWFYDGPIAKALETLQGIYRVLVQSREDQQRFANENNKKLDDQTDILRDIKDCITRERSSSPRRRP